MLNFNARVAQPPEEARSVANWVRSANRSLSGRYIRRAAYAHRAGDPGYQNLLTVISYEAHGEARPLRGRLDFQNGLVLEEDAVESEVMDAQIAECFVSLRQACVSS
jgi:hypothetical protein